MNALKTFKSLDGKTVKVLTLLFSAGLLFWTAMTLFLPILPIYAASIGGTDQEIGFVVGCFAIGLIGSRTYLGRLADEKGRKIVVLIGTVVCALAPFGYLFASNVHLLMAIRAFHGISVAAFTTGYSALVVDLSPVKQRGELIGYMTLCVPVGMAIGPALGSFLQEDLGGYRAVFLTAAVAGSLSFILASQVKEPPLPARSDYAKNESSRTTWQIISSPSLLIPALLLLMIGLVFGTLTTFLPLYVRHLHLDLKIGFFYTAAAISSFVIRILAGSASDRYGRGIFISGSLLCYCLAMILIADASSPVTLLMAGSIEGLGGGLLIPMILVLLSDRCYPQERGKVFSVCTTGFDLGIALAGPIFGSLSSTLNYQSIFIVSALQAFFALFLFLSFSNKTPSSSFSFALGLSKDNHAV